jgi:tight adherence protein B
MVSMGPVAACAAALAIAGAVLQEVAHRRALERERVIARVEAVSRRAAMRSVGPGTLGALDAWLEEIMLGVGLAPRRWYGVAARGLAVLLFVLGAWRWGLLGAIGLPSAFAALVGLEVLRRQRRRRVLLLGQLPAFLDHVVRAVQAGGSVPQALASATTESVEPLRGLFDRVERQTRVGASLEDALENAGAGQGLRQLDMVALVIRLNQRYGGSVREIMSGIVTMIRQRERAQRDVLALTAETRLSAWVLALLPVGLALYIVWMNPGYLQTMWMDPVGRTLLSIAIGLQAVGSLLLWRMVRSV